MAHSFAATRPKSAFEKANGKDRHLVSGKGFSFSGENKHNRERVSGNGLSEDD